MFKTKFFTQQNFVEINPEEVVLSHLLVIFMN